MITHTRRIAAGAIAAAACLALSACGAAAAPPASEQDRNVTVTTYEGTSSFESYLVMKTGFFKKHGINVEEVVMPAGPQATNAFLSGSIDVHFIDVISLFPVLAKGEELEVISGAAGMYWTIVGDKGRSEKNWPQSITQLRGMKVAVPVKGSAADHIMTNTAIAAGMKPGDINTVATGGFPQSIAALESGQVDAAILEPLSSAKMLGQGYPSLFSYQNPRQKADVYPAEITDVLEQPEINYLARKEWREENPDVVKDFQAAIEEGFAYIQDPANFDEVVRLLRNSNYNIPSLDDKQFKTFVQGQLDLYDASYSKEAAESWSSFAKRVGISGAESIPAPEEWVSAGLLGESK